MTSPLDKVRVIDLSRAAPGGYCAMLLGDLGAEVIRVEAPAPPGDRFGSAWSMTDERDAAFHAINRNKKSFVLNLRDPDGVAIFHRLCAQSDVVLEGFRPGVAQRLKIDYEMLRTINPRLIYCSISGYGQDGPYRELPGHDPNYISFAGALGLIGPKGDEPPVLPLNIVADYAGGAMHAAVGVLAALLAREQTGRGQFVDISLTDTVVSLLVNFFSAYFTRGEVAQRGQTLLSGAYPMARTYRTKDGKYVSLGCMETWFWENICKAIGREDLIPHQLAEGERRAEVIAAFEETFATKTRDEWWELLRDKNVCAGKVYDLDEAVDDPQLVFRNMFVSVDAGIAEPVRQVGLAIKMSDTPAGIRHTGPVYDQHTDELLGALGCDPAEIGRLRAAGVAGWQGNGTSRH